jgi:hypothetical protein
VTARVVAIIPVVLWGGELFAGLVSGTDPSPDPANPPIVFRLMGLNVYGNLLFSTVMIVVSAVAYGLIGRSPDSRRP